MCQAIYNAPLRTPLQCSPLLDYLFFITPIVSFNAARHAHLKLPGHRRVRYAGGIRSTSGIVKLSIIPRRQRAIAVVNY